MGLMQRSKGKRFEREIADVLRKAFPGVLVRRASQGERADMPDVFVDVQSAYAERKLLLSRLWLECQDARNPTPSAKLEQAERDVRARLVHSSFARFPVAITHKLGAREVLATMRLKTACYLEDGHSGERANEIVTMDLGSFLAVVQRAIESGRS